MYMSDWECVALKLFAVGLDDWGLLEIWVKKVGDKNSFFPGPEWLYYLFLLSDFKNLTL